MPTRPSSQKPNYRRWWWALPALLLCLLALALIPWPLVRPISSPLPATTHVEALQKLTALQAQEPTDAMNTLCRSQLLDHGRRTAKAIILVHGYTSCPHQFRELGQQLYNRGYNVLLAPMPYHGLADRMSEAHSLLTANDLVAYTHTVMDIGRGLGDTLVMAGLSAGGVVAAYAARYRQDLDIAMLISPAFGYKSVPAPLTAAAMNVFAVLPDGYGWWNEQLQAQGGVPHGYPRYSKRALAQLLRLSFAARKGKPQVGQMIVVTNPNDAAVNNALTEQTCARWRRWSVPLTTYAFPQEWQLDHDLIEPAHPKAQIEKVYPKLIDLLP